MNLDAFYYDPTSPTGIRWAINRPPRRMRGDVAGYKVSDGYWQVEHLRQRERTHRVVWMLHNGPIPEGVEIDHIKGKANNIENLRLADDCQNQHNIGLKSANKSGVKGVHRQGNSWIATIQHRHIKYYLGSFASLYDAATAVRNKRNELHGAYANHG